jgi:outer membrane protein
VAPAQIIVTSPDLRSRISTARAWLTNERHRRITLMSARDIIAAFERGGHVAAPLVFATLCVALPAFAQSPLSLSDAIARAKAGNPDAGSAAAAEREAAERVTQARGGYFPKVDVAESWQRGNHPAFVFSSLLAQRQFSVSNFALDALNHPAAVDDFRTAISVEQSLFDRATAANVRAASISREMTATGKQLVEQDLTFAVTEAFGRVLIAAATARSAAATVESAHADRELVGHRREAGRVTDADVLQMDVYLARTLEQQVQATSDERVARARLNQLMGEQLSTTFSLDPTPPVIVIDVTSPAKLEEDALKNRPEVVLARQRERLAKVSVNAARAAFLPQVLAQAGWELNGGAWNSRSSSWVAGVTVRINAFRGLADKARLTEARVEATRRALETRKAETMARLDVQIAIARLEAAQASEAVGRAAADQARESRRIIRDRYGNGLTDAAMLLRAADAVQQADVQQIAAHVNVITAAASLQRAIGKL